jgi:hypothetical protein
VKVTPICKYGHGALEQQTAFGSTSWVIPAIDMTGFGDEGQEVLSAEELAKMSQPAFTGAFTLGIYRCNVCGYLEFFDIEVPDGGA